ncbi:MAG TPA: hypothetical protein VN238_02950, partial [Solirubrobacteraceae bacterium]|nr:hypothetical protein [Solirubrobacteraceae bacterium]
IALPVAEELSHGFTAGAEVFDALSESPRSLDQTIARSPRTLREVATAPSTAPALRGLTDTVDTLDPMLRYLGPHVTVCNYWNYWWTYLSDHISEEVDTGTVQRILVKLSNPLQPNGPATFGASEPANGGPNLPTLPGIGTLGDSVNLHAQPYGRAVDENGNADCETGQRGFPRRLAPEGFRPDLNIAVSARTPGNQGPTYSGKPKVPEGQTFSAEPTGLAPQVAGK